MHERLKAAIEDYRQNKLPIPPDHVCHHCGGTMTVGEPEHIRHWFQDGFRNNGIKAGFEVKYYCPESRRLKAAMSYDTEYPTLGWHHIWFY